MFKSNHLSEVHLSYLAHAHRSVGFVLFGLKLCVFAIIHTLFPDVFVNSFSESIHIMNDKLRREHEDN